MRWSWRLFFAALAVLALVAFAGYRLLDQAISLSYAKDSLRTTEVSYEQLTGLLTAEWAGLSEREVHQRLQAAAAKNPDKAVLVKRESDEGLIWFGNTRFEFKDGRLIAVR